MEYALQSDRLGLRNWQASDIRPFFEEVNQDSEVMRYFPAVPDLTQTEDFVSRMQGMFGEKGYCYFAVDRLDSGEFIGFIGLMDQRYKSDFTPCVDIGWRLKRSAWGQGFATEGAHACIDYGFKQLNMEEIVSVAPLVNRPSIQVMEKIGMRRLRVFDHPLLQDNAYLRQCVLYKKTAAG